MLRRKLKDEEGSLPPMVQEPSRSCARFQADRPHSWCSTPPSPAGPPGGSLYRPCHCTRRALHGFHESREVLALARPLSAHLSLHTAFPSLIRSHLGAFSTHCSLCFIHASPHITPEVALRDLAPCFVFPHRTHLCLTT